MSLTLVWLQFVASLFFLTYIYICMHRYVYIYILPKPCKTNYTPGNALSEQAHGDVDGERRPTAAIQQETSHISKGQPCSCNAKSFFYNILKTNLKVSQSICAEKMIGTLPNMSASSLDFLLPRDACMPQPWSAHQHEGPKNWWTPCPCRWAQSYGD